MKQLPQSFLFELLSMYTSDQVNQIEKEDTQLVHQETILMLRCWQEIFEKMAKDCEQRKA